MYQFIFVVVLPATLVSKSVSDENCTFVCVCVCVCVCASGEDDVHKTYILLISLKVIVTTVTRKSVDIKMYGSF